MSSERYHLINGRGDQSDLLLDTQELVFYYLNSEGWNAAKKGVSQPLGPPKRHSEPQIFHQPDAQPVLERLVLMVTTECNLCCRYCYAEGGNYGMHPKPMPLEVALQTVRWAQSQFSAIGVIQFFGGEPSLNSQVICEVCAAVERSGWPVPPQYGIVTNGVYLPSTLQSAIQQYNMRVTLSIDGPAPVHDLHRVRLDGTGSFRSLLRNFNVLRAAGIEVGAEMTFTPQALEMGWGIWELADFSVNSLGIQDPHIVPVCTQSGPTCWGRHNASALAGSYRSAVVSAFNSFLYAPRPVTFSLFSGILRTLITRKGRDVICPAGIGTLAVDPEGDIYPCFMFAGQVEYCLGNVFESEIHELWDKLSQFISLNYKGARPECRSCWARRLCTGCMGNIQMTQGSLEGRWEVMCQVMQEMAAEVMLQLASIRQDVARWNRFVSKYKQIRLGSTSC